MALTRYLILESTFTTAVHATKPVLTTALCLKQASMKLQMQFLCFARKNKDII